MKKRVWIPIVVIVITLIALRIAAPHIIKKYVNKTLSNLEGYDGYVDDIDLNLFRGAYVIDSITIRKIEGDVPVPFVDIAALDISVQWKALFQGAIVGEILMQDPRVNFVAGPTAKEEQYGGEVNWLEKLKELIPLRINRFEINNGEIAFKNYNKEPKVDLLLENLNVIATNLSNVVNEEDTLPSNLSISAHSMGGDLELLGDMNVLKETPDMDMNLSFNGVDLTELNSFTKGYAKFDFNAGQLDLAVEFAMYNGDYEGYVKPLFKDVDIINFRKEDKNFFKKVWEGIVGLGFEIFENQKHDQTATKVPFQGSVQNTDVNIWRTIVTLLSNAFVEALQSNVDDTIEFENVS